MLKFILTLIIGSIFSITLSGQDHARRGFMVSDLEKETVNAVRYEWNANLVRLQLVPLSWASQKNITPSEAWNWLMTKLPGWLDNAREHGIVVVIDLHHIPKSYMHLPSQEALREFWQDPEAREMFLACWREIAAICQHRQEEIWFDLLNEPLNWDDMPSFPKKWPEWAQQCIYEIRKIDTNHHIVIEPGPGGLSWGFKDFPLLNDPSDKLIYSTHQYQPHAYTMQGIQDITGTDLAHAYLTEDLHWPGIFSDSGGGYWDKNRLETEELAAVIEFQKKHKVRIYIGEFSVVRWAPDAVQYLDDCISIFEKYGWDWSYHAFRECHVWSLEHDDTKSSAPKAAATPVKRAIVIKKYLNRNKFAAD